MQTYDIYLNGVGYMLAKGPGGNAQGIYKDQATDPLTRSVSNSELLERAVFRFEDGAGLRHHDGSKRYRWGTNIDTRSGSLIRGPDWVLPGAVTGSWDSRVEDPDRIDAFPLSVNAADVQAYASGSWTNNGWILTHGGAGGESVDFSSREGANRPQLLVTYY